MDYRDFNIDIRSSKTSGEVQCLCPECSHTRKKKSDKCLSVNLDKQSWFCHHCGFKGKLLETIEKIEYIIPEWKNKTKISENVVKWFESRSISQKTLTEFKITSGPEWMPQTQKEENTIQFNYFRSGELVNVKYRSGAKHFKLHKGSELIFYNLDCISNYNNIIICEGEIDALSFYECGYKNVVSVPNGANINTNNLQYVDNCIELFDKIETIYLATDNDIAGRKLRIELAERFGIERCKYLEFEEFKDCNDLLKSKGKIGVDLSLQNAKDFPLEGVFTISDIDLEINDMYVNGLDHGKDTGMYDFDDHLRFTKGYITTITGVPGHGKSDFLDQLALKLNIKHGWKFAFYSPENKPTRLHVSKLVRKLIGKKWFGEDRLSVQDLENSKKYLDGKFWFIKPEKDFTLETILTSVKVLKKTKGIDAFVIDAWNKLEHKYGQSETKYIGESLDKIAIFCEENNVHCFLVAHPTKLTKNKENGLFEIPNLYSIAGSANFYNKTDNGITVYRNFETDKSEVFIQKVKFSHWGKIGKCEFIYDLNSGRYMDDCNLGVQFSWLPDQIKTIELETSPFPMIALEDVSTVFDEINFDKNNNDETDVPF